MEGPYTRYPRATLWLVQEGDMPMGGEAPDAQPHFEVEVPSFYISRAPITNEQFEVFRPDHPREPSDAPDDAPVVNVSWEDAAGYCAWYAEFTGKPFRLPSEELEARFVTEAAGEGLLALKGYRTVGGVRASIYNAVEPASVDALVDFMGRFESTYG